MIGYVVVQTTVVWTDLWSSFVFGVSGDEVRTTTSISLCWSIGVFGAARCWDSSRCYCSAVWKPMEGQASSFQHTSSKVSSSSNVDVVLHVLFTLAIVISLG